MMARFRLRTTCGRACSAAMRLADLTRLARKAPPMRLHTRLGWVPRKLKNGGSVRRSVADAVARILAKREAL